MAREFSTSDTPQRTPSHDDIARRAYEIFIERGQPIGQDMAHWLEAESQLCAAMREQKSAAAPAAKAQRPAARQNGPRRT